MHDHVAPQPFQLFSRRSLQLVVVVVTANLLFDFLLLNLMAVVQAGSAAPGWWLGMYERPCAEAFLIGTFASQIVMGAVWTALFPGNSALRLLLATLITIGAALGLSVKVATLSLGGLYLRAPSGPVDSWQTLAGALYGVAVFLLLFYVVQIPFWLLRRTTRMRIVHDPQGELAAPANGPWRLVDLFGVVSFLAVPMALARVTAAVESISNLLICVVALSVAMIVFGLPYLWAILGAKRLAWGVAAAVALSEAVALLGSQAYLLVEPRVRPADWPIVLAAFHCVQAATLVIALTTGVGARTVGYRLVWVWPWRTAKRRSAAGLTSAQPAPARAPP